MRKQYRVVSLTKKKERKTKIKNFSRFFNLEKATDDFVKDILQIVKVRFYESPGISLLWQYQYCL